MWICCARFSTSGFRLPAGLSCDCPAPARIRASAFWTFFARFSFSGFQLGTRSLAQLQRGLWFLVFDSSLDSLLASQLPACGFRPGSRAIARLQLRFRCLVADISLDLLCSLLNFWFPVSASSWALARLPGSSLCSGSRFPVLDSGLDLLRSLPNFWFPISGWALVRLPSSSSDSSFWFFLFQFQFVVWTCSARFSILGVRFLACLS